MEIQRGFRIKVGTLSSGEGSVIHIPHFSFLAVSSSNTVVSVGAYPVK